MDSSSSLPSAPQGVTPADNDSVNLNPTPNPKTTSVTTSQNGTPYSSPRHTGNGSDTSSPSSAPAFRQNGHKSCDACKTRKVKCPNVDYPNPCGNCVRRKEACHFGTKKVPRRNVTKHLRYTQPCANQGESAPGTMLCYADAPNSDGSTGNGGSTRDRRDSIGLIPSLYVDHMIAQAQAQAKTHGKQEAFVEGNGIFGGSYSLTFFSESRLVSLSKRLHNNKVSELVRRMNGIISGRLRRSNETANGDTTTTSGSGNRSSSGAASSGPSLYIASITDDTPPMPVDPEFAASCFHYYFEHVHNIYPFLDRAAFKARALPVGEEGEKALAKSLKRSKAWSSLYYTVMAIGCVYSEASGSGSNNGTPAANASFLGHLANMTTKQSSTPGSFEPGKGTAWRLFSMALANLSDLFILPDSLLTLQALTAMVIYCLGVSCLSIERVVLAEASRRAQSLASNFGTSAAGSTTSSVTFQRTFWVLYAVEKIMSFHFGRSSTFVDSDIACPIPVTIDDGDDPPAPEPSVSSTATSCWFLLAVRHARLLSRTYSSLFSVGKARVSTANNLATIDRLCDEAEEWRQSIPSTRGLRPECSSWRGSNRSSSSSTTHGNSTSKTSMALRSTVLAERNISLALRFLYHSLVVILARARLHHLSLHQADVENQKKKDADSETSTETEERPSLDVKSLERDARRALMSSARGILELTPMVDVEPYMPLWSLAVIPLTALFVLFDLVVDQPNDEPQGSEPRSGPRKISSDTALNLALLDMAAGYFSRIEYASNSSLPGSLISEFAHIARDYINDYQRGVSVHAPLPPPPPPPPPTETVRRSSPEDDCSGAVHPIPLLQPTTRIISQHSEQPSHSEQRPLPLPPPIMVHQQQPTPPIQPQINLMDGSGLTGWPSSSVSGVTSVPSTSDGSIPLVGGPNVGNFTDGLGYGFGTEPYQPGNADFSGTDVMGLFTSNHFFLSEMDGILYNGV